MAILDAYIAQSRPEAPVAQPVVFLPEVPAALSAAQFDHKAKMALTATEIPAASRAYSHAGMPRQDVNLNMRLLEPILNPLHARVPEAVSKPLNYLRLRKLNWSDYSAFLVDRIASNVTERRYMSDNARSLCI